MKTIEQGKAEVAKLVRYFETNREHFAKAEVKEAHIRQSLIDPLFEALGWDVSNREQIAPQYREVVPEPSLDDEGQKRAPDYAFRIGPETKFYTEAKKLNQKILDDPTWAHQLRRYGWSSKLAFSILTDFEELAVYDCTVPPKLKEKASHRRIKDFRYDQYVDRWQELWDVFSREAVWSGAFDKYASSKRKAGTSEVDSEFLKAIEEWRDSLAKNIALRNSTIGSEDLNSAVQLTIDRIVFLRMAEDRGLEPYQRLLKLCESGGIYKRFMKDLCRKADGKYNSGLFHFENEPDVSEQPDTITPKIEIDDKVIKPIIEGLYFEHGSPYDFKMLPVEILGTVYERFLGKVITLTASHKAEIKKKPEVRKAGGVYYTPAYIVQNIVEKTIIEQIKGRSPADLAGSRGKQPFRVLDMACGSGSFLLGAYRALLDHCLNWYAAHPDDAKKKTYIDPISKDLRLNIGEKKRILTTHVFGVDIDRQAVEVSKLSLLLKALEGENNATLEYQRVLFDAQRALPNLSENIKCGNSLISMDFYTSSLPLEAEDEGAIKAFDWEKQFPNAIKSGGFDCVIGNPPYDVVEKDRKKASWPHSALTNYVRVVPDYKQALGGKLNLYRFFLIRGLKLLKSGGRMGMIVPLSLLGDISTAGTRKRVFSSLAEVTCDCFPQKDNKFRRVFRDAKLSTLVIAGALPKGKPDDPPFQTRIFPWNLFLDSFRECQFRLSEMRIIDKKNLPIPLVDSLNWGLCKWIYNNPKVARLGEVAGIHIRRGEVNQTVYKAFITSDSRHSRMLKGVEVGRYRLNSKLSQGEQEWFDEKKFLKTSTVWDEVARKRIATQRISGVDEKERIIATMVDGPCYFADSTNSITVDGDDEEWMCYLLGLLNSRLFQWRFKMTSTNNNVGTNELMCMPYLQNAANDMDRKKLVAVVRKMIDVNKRRPGGRLGASGAVQEQLKSLNDEADGIVYRLYGMSDDDIAIIEGKAVSQPTDMS